MSATETATRTTTWNLDASHSNVGFAVKHMMIATVRGHFSEVSATVELDGTDYATAQIDAEIKADSITTRNDQRDAHLRSADFFDVEQFPTLTFRSTRVSVKSENQLEVTGDLTIHGVTKSAKLNVSIEGRVKDPWGNQRMAIEAETKIKRADYGLLYNQALETGGVMVSDDIRITIEGELVLAA